MCKFNLHINQNEIVLRQFYDLLTGLNGDVCNYLKERTETNLSQDDVNHIEESRLIIAARLIDFIIDYLLF